jgi:hypothetical protein
MWVIAGVLGGLVGSGWAAKATFRGVGDLPGGPYWSNVRGVSGDGKVAFGYSYDRDVDYTAFRWTRNKGMEPLADGPTAAWSASKNGSVIACEGLFPPKDRLNGLDIGYRWDNGTSIALTAFGHETCGYVISDDANCLAGVAWDGSKWVGGLWDIEGELASVLGEQFWPMASSRTGAYFAGYHEDRSLSNYWQRHAPYIWTRTGGIQELPDLPGGSYPVSEVHDMNPDATVFVGYGSKWFWGQRQPVMWRRTGNTVTIYTLGISPLNIQFGEANTVDGTGNLAGGYLTDTAWNQKAILWMWGIDWDLKDYLKSAYNLDSELSGWTLTEITGISDDGRTIVGNGISPTSGPYIEGWIVSEDRDSDGDGLLDSWEEDQGIDINGDGTNEVELPGANPDHKDLFIEVDILDGQIFSVRSQNMVKKKFQEAPVNNPDNNTGITLHILVDEQNLISPEPVWTTVPHGGWAPVFDTIKADHFGTVEDQASSNKANILAARRKAYRYCIIADKIDDGSLGTSEILGNDFFTTMGQETPPVTSTLRAAVFMHEFGHTLGLKHGGADHINGKPNYISIMNYILSVPLDFSRSFWKMDYSRAQLDILNENSLDETRGIRQATLPVPFLANVKMPFAFNDPSSPDGRTIVFAQLNGSPIDWDWDGDPNDTAAVADLNYLGYLSPYYAGFFGSPSPGEEMQGYNDWAKLQYAIGETGDYADLEHNTVSEDKTTPELFLYLNDTIPAIAGPGDINADGQVNEVDFVLLAAAWLAEAGDDNWNYACDIAKPADDIIDFADLAVLADNWLNGI